MLHKSVTTLPRCWRSLYVITIITIIIIITILILSAQWMHLIGSPAAEAGTQLSLVLLQLLTTLKLFYAH